MRKEGFQLSTTLLLHIALMKLWTVGLVDHLVQITQVSNKSQELQTQPLTPSGMLPMIPSKMRLLFHSEGLTVVTGATGGPISNKL